MSCSSSGSSPSRTPGSCASTVVNHGLGAHLNLDAAKAGRRFARELRLVERDLAEGGFLLHPGPADVPRKVLYGCAGGRRLGTEREGPPAGANLEERAQIRGTGYPPNAFADRPRGALRG